MLWPHCVPPLPAECCGRLEPTRTRWFHVHIPHLVATTPSERLETSACDGDAGRPAPRGRRRTSRLEWPTCGFCQYCCEPCCCWVATVPSSSFTRCMPHRLFAFAAACALLPYSSKNRNPKSKACAERRHTTNRRTDELRGPRGRQSLPPTRRRQSKALA